MSVETNLYALALLFGDVVNALFGDGKNTARAACAIVNGVGSVAQLVGDGQHGDVGQQRNIVARSEVFSCFGYAILLVKLAQQLLEKRSHGVIVYPWQPFVALGIEHGVFSEVYFGIGKLLDDAAQAASVAKVVYLLFQLELLDNVLYVLGKAVEILQEVLF